MLRWHGWMLVWVQVRRASNNRHRANECHVVYDHRYCCRPTKTRDLEVKLLRGL